MQSASADSKWHNIYLSTTTVKNDVVSLKGTSINNETHETQFVTSEHVQA